MVNPVATDARVINTGWRIFTLEPDWITVTDFSSQTTGPYVARFPAREARVLAVEILKMYGLGEPDA